VQLGDFAFLDMAAGRGSRGLVCGGVTTSKVVYNRCARVLARARAAPPKALPRRDSKRDHQCDQEMLVRKERQNAIAKKFGRAVQRVRVPSDQSLASGSVASLAASVATLGPMRRHASG